MHTSENKLVKETGTLMVMSCLLLIILSDNVSEKRADVYQ